MQIILTLFFVIASLACYGKLPRENENELKAANALSFGLGILTALAISFTWIYL